MADLIELVERGDKIVTEEGKEVIGKVELIGGPRFVLVEKEEIGEKVHPDSTVIFQAEILKEAPKGADSYIVGGLRDPISKAHPLISQPYPSDGKDYMTLAVQYCKRM